jgi:hypothetical protein
VAFELASLLPIQPEGGSFPLFQGEYDCQEAGWGKPRNGLCAEMEVAVEGRQDMHMSMCQRDLVLFHLILRKTL